MFERSSLGVSRTIDVHRLTTSWSEGTVRWDLPWATNGGDYNATSVASFSPVWTGVLKRDSVNVTTSVQNFANSTFTNFGWLLKINTEDATQQFWEFYSKEWGTSSENLF